MSDWPDELPEELRRRWADTIERVNARLGLGGREPDPSIGWAELVDDIRTLRAAVGEFVHTDGPDDGTGLPWP